MRKNFSEESFSEVDNWRPLCANLKIQCGGRLGVETGTNAADAGTVLGRLQNWKIRA